MRQGGDAVDLRPRGVGGVRDAETRRALRAHRLGAAAARIGTVVADERCFVQLRTPLGGRRMVDWLAAEQLPRIC